MEAQESTLSGTTTITTTISGDLSCSSQLNNESEISSTTSDSGCDGDDEESSVEITKMVNNKQEGHTTCWTDSASADDEDEVKFQQILKGSFPLMSTEGKQIFNWQRDTRSDPPVANGGFKHPQLCGIQGQRSGGYRKFRKKPPPLSGIATPHELCQRLADFVSHETEIKLQLPMLSRGLCHTASRLAHAHRLEFIMTQQKRLLPVAAPLLKRTRFTCLASKSDVDAIVRDYERDLINPVLWSSGKKTKGKRILSVSVPLSTLGSKKVAGVVPSTQVVGVDAPPISDTNIGNMMLRNMGWKPGTGLGAHESGICNPVCASKRPKQTGLGYA